MSEAKFHLTATSRLALPQGDEGGSFINGPHSTDPRKLSKGDEYETQSMPLIDMVVLQCSFAVAGRNPGPLICMQL